MNIKRGDLVEVRTASGTTETVRALTGPMAGRDFPVVWVCTESAWTEIQAAGDDRRDGELGVPWPVDSVLELHPA